jgi:antitoxin YefM
MATITYSEARSKLAETMEKVCDDHAPIIITRKNSRSVVMISLDDFKSLEETSYLLRSPRNARRLLESIANWNLAAGPNGNSWSECALFRACVGGLSVLAAHRPKDPRPNQSTHQRYTTVTLPGNWQTRAPEAWTRRVLVPANKR